MNNLEIAKQMEAKFQDRKSIRLATGWEKGGDGKWRYEINDGQLTNYANDILKLGSKNKIDTTLSKVYDNEELYNAYPFLRRIKITAHLTNGKNDVGSYSSVNGIDAYGPTKEGIRSTIIHEVQHAIQEHEGFSTGGNPDTILGILFNKYQNRDRFNYYSIYETIKHENGNEKPAYIIADDLGFFTNKNVYATKEDAQTALNNAKEELLHLEQSYKQLVQERASNYEAYRRLAGEVESRNAETRKDFSVNERSNNTLLSTEDIDPETKIHIFGDNGSSLSTLEQTPAIQKIINYLKLQPKKISVNKTGYVSENGAVGINLANRIGEVIKEQGLENLVGARWNKTDQAVEFFPIDRQGILFQPEAKGAYEQLTNTIYALTSPDVTTPLHELAHSWEPLLTPAERNNILEWAKTKEWSTETSEKFASGFEQYLSEGKAPTPELKSAFDKFADWLKNIVQKVRALFGNDFTLNDNMRNIYTEMLNGKAAVEPVVENNVKVILAKNNTGDVYTFNIQNNNKEVGVLKAVNDGQYLTVNEANVTTPRQGVGIEAYRQLVNKLL
jgi:hypothetical protein